MEMSETHIKTQRTDNRKLLQRWGYVMWALWRQKHSPRSTPSESHFHFPDAFTYLANKPLEKKFASAQHSVEEKQTWKILAYFRNDYKHKQKTKI
jgi:hypothetical protein